MGWEQDPDTGLWWDGSDGPYDGQWRKLPSKPEEVVPLARALALNAETAGLITISSDGFPRCRTVTVGKYISEDFADITVATRAKTRKCEEITNNNKATVFWQDKTGSGAWVSAACSASVEPSDRDDGKAKVRLTTKRLEIQDYNANITGCGTDCWKPMILERVDGAWNKVQ
jgi:hypothetical protein